ncbi:hypothetical protein ACH5RR_037071, partial [Cinchona calisaya]
EVPLWFFIFRSILGHMLSNYLGPLNNCLAAGDLGIVVYWEDVFLTDSVSAVERVPHQLAKKGPQREVDQENEHVDA